MKKEEEIGYKREKRMDCRGKVWVREKKNVGIKEKRIWEQVKEEI